jgi:hypothetical protein
VIDDDAALGTRGGNAEATDVRKRQGTDVKDTISIAARLGIELLDALTDAAAARLIEELERAHRAETAPRDVNRATESLDELSVTEIGENVPDSVGGASTGCAAE